MAGLRAYREEQRRLYPLTTSPKSAQKDRSPPLVPDSARRRQVDEPELALHRGSLAPIKEETEPPGPVLALPPDVPTASAAVEARWDDFSVHSPDGSDFVKGCTGHYYRIPGRVENGENVWRKLDKNGERFLYSNKSGLWVICTSEKEIPKNNGHVKSQVPHNGRRPGAMTMDIWQRHNGTAWVDDASISVVSLAKNNLEVLSAAREELAKSRRQERAEQNHEVSAAKRPPSKAQPHTSPRTRTKKEELERPSPGPEASTAPRSTQLKDEKRQLNAAPQHSPPRKRAKKEEIERPSAMPDAVAPRDAPPPAAAAAKDVAGPAPISANEKAVRICVSDYLHEMRPGLRISKSAMESIIGSVHDVVRHLTREASDQAEAVGKTGVSSKEALKAVYAVLPLPMASRAEEKANDEMRRRGQ